MSQFCANCGSKIDKRARFCVSCGQQVGLTNEANAVRASNGLEPSKTRTTFMGSPWSPRVHILFGVLTLLATLGVIGSFNEEERRTCASVSTIITPVSTGQPRVQDFEKAFLFLNELAQSTANSELKTAILNVTSAGLKVTSQFREKGEASYGALALSETRLLELVEVCNEFQ